MDICHFSVERKERIFFLLKLFISLVHGRGCIGGVGWCGLLCVRTCGGKEWNVNERISVAKNTFTMPFSIFPLSRPFTPTFLQFCWMNFAIESYHEQWTLNTEHTYVLSLVSLYSRFSLLSATIKYSKLTNVNCIRSSIRVLTKKWKFYFFYFHQFLFCYFTGVACIIWQCWLVFDSEFSSIFPSYKCEISRGLTLHEELFCPKMGKMAVSAQLN